MYLKQDHDLSINTGLCQSGVDIKNLMPGSPQHPYPAHLVLCGVHLRADQGHQGGLATTIAATNPRTSRLSLAGQWACSLEWWVLVSPCNHDQKKSMPLNAKRCENSLGAIAGLTLLEVKHRKNGLQQSTMAVFEQLPLRIQLRTKYKINDCCWCVLIFIPRGQPQRNYHWHFIG